MTLFQGNAPCHYCGITINTTVDYGKTWYWCEGPYSTEASVVYNPPVHIRCIDYDYLCFTCARGYGYISLDYLKQMMAADQKKIGRTTCVVCKKYVKVDERVNTMWLSFQIHNQCYKRLCQMCQSAKVKADCGTKSACKTCCKCGPCEICGVHKVTEWEGGKCDKHGRTCIACRCTVCGICKLCHMECKLCNKCPYSCGCNSEVTVAKREWGLSREYPLVKAVAKFYLLEHLAALAPRRHGKRFRQYAADLAKVIADYADMIIGGELRHGISYCPTLLPRGFKGQSRGGRGVAWDAWKDLRKEFGLGVLEEAEYAFRKGEWSPAYGGDAWADIAMHLLMYLKGEYSPEIFVDVAIDLEHNGGNMFNKLWGSEEANRLKYVLDAKFQGELETVAGFVGPDEAVMYRIEVFRINRDIYEVTRENATLFFEKVEEKYAPMHPYYEGRRGD